MDDMDAKRHRKQLDNILLVDAYASIIFGSLALLTPHGIITFLAGGTYNHGAHEALRLYGSLRVAMGWILHHVRKVDDGLFRRSICEALCVCYVLQCLAVFRAQMTDQRTWINWISLILLSTLGSLYGIFRFGKRGNLIKIYELPSSSVRDDH